MLVGRLALGWYAGEPGATKDNIEMLDSEIEKLTTETLKVDEVVRKLREAGCLGWTSD